MMTSVQSTPGVTGLLDTLHTEGCRLNIKKHHRYLEAGLDEDDYQETLNEIAALKLCYNNKSDMR